MKRVAIIALAAVLGAVSAGAADVMLTFKHPEGSRVMRVEDKISQVLTLAGTEVPTRLASTTLIRTDVGKRAEDGSIRLKYTFTGLKAELEAAGDLKAAFDSDKPDESRVDNPQLQPVVDAWKAVKGLSYTVVLDSTGKVKTVEGTETLPAVLSPAASSFSAANLKREAEEELGLFPPTPVKKGERWLRLESKDLGGGQSLSYETYYQYEGPVEKDGRTLDKLSVFISTARLSIDPNSQLPARVKQSDLKVESSTGHVLFDRERGMVVERSTSTRIVGTLVLDVMGMELAGKLDLGLEQTISERK